MRTLPFRKFRLRPLSLPHTQAANKMEDNGAVRFCVRRIFPFLGRVDCGFPAPADFFWVFFLANFRGVFLIGHPVVPRDFTRWVENCTGSSTGFRSDVKPGSNSSQSVSPAKTTICTVSRGRLRRRNQTKGNLPLAFQFVCGPGEGFPLFGCAAAGARGIQYK